MSNSKKFRNEFFNKELKNLLEQKTKSILLTKQRYDEMIREFLDAEKKSEKLRNEYEKKLLKNYNLFTFDGKKRLIKNDPNLGTKFYVHTGELFRIFEKVHNELKHCGAKSMYNHLRETYLNITMESIKLYIQTCDYCTVKKSSKNINTEQFSKCMIDLIDMNDFNDGIYPVILKYQDVRTKFCILKPLKEGTAKQVAKELHEIFGMFGAPQILGCKNSQKFAENVKEKLKDYYDDDFKIIIGKKESKIKEDIESEIIIKKILNDLCRNKNIQSWTKIIPDLQYMLNTMENKINHRTPFERFFGRKPNFGLEFALPKNFKSEDLIEEKLEKFCHQHLNEISKKHSKITETKTSKQNDSAIIILDENNDDDNDDDEEDDFKNYDDDTDDDGDDEDGDDD